MWGGPAGGGGGGGVDLPQAPSLGNPLVPTSLFIIVELHLSGRWLSGSPFIRIGMTLGVHLSTIPQN